MIGENITRELDKTAQEIGYGIAVIPDSVFFTKSDKNYVVVDDEVRIPTGIVLNSEFFELFD